MVFPCKWQFSRPSVRSTTWFLSLMTENNQSETWLFFPWTNRRVSTSNVCLPLDMGLGTKPEQDCRSFTKYEAEICCLHLSHPSPLLFSISHPSSLTTSNRGGNRALGKKVGPSLFKNLFKNLCQHNSKHGGCSCTIRCNPLSSLSYALSLQICLVSHLRHEFTFETLEKELK